MAKQSKLEERAEQLLEPVAQRFGVRVYDVEYCKEGPDYFLRCYIDKDGGVNIGDCENVSRVLSDILDADDFIPNAYVLEVSSPGLGRSLTKDRHFAASIGEEVEGTLFRAAEETDSKSFQGILKAFDADTVSIEAADGTALVLERKNISKISLTIDF